MQNIWDKKSTNYARFSKEPSEFQKELFAKLDSFGVDFGEKKVIDIGCGTGVHTLKIAMACNSVLGIDSSYGMLEVLNSDAVEFGIKNIKTLHTDWENFKPSDYYDIAICTMSPAIKTDDDFAKFNEIADKKIYLGWQRPRNSDLLSVFFNKFGSSKQDALTGQRLKTWLQERNIGFKSALISETRIVQRSYDEALDNICWHLQINKLDFKKDEVKALLDNIVSDKNNKVEEKIDSLMCLFVF